MKKETTKKKERENEENLLKTKTTMKKNGKRETRVMTLIMQKWDL